MEVRSRVLTRRGLRRGCVSVSFSIEDLAKAVCDRLSENVYAELDTEGHLTCRGGPARAVALSALAPSAPAAGLLLEQAPAPPTGPTTARTRLRLRLLTDAPPHTDLTLWFDENTLALLDMPFLTLRNISGKSNYACHECGAEYEHPNPLKVHLFLKCQAFDQTAFWTKCLAILQRNTSWPISLPMTSPADIEVIAAAWGRSRDGHICVYCGKLYSRKYGLKIHIRTHTGYKPLRCRHCLRAFGDPSNLNKHVRLHATSPSTPHTCTLCGKALARRRDLQRHLRSHHT